MNRLTKKTYVTFSDVKYHINDDKRTIACELTASFCPPNNAIIQRTYIPKIKKLNYYFIGSSTNSFVGVARCHINDTYDKLTGMRIAESKAKAEAFKWANHIMRDFLSHIIVDILTIDKSISLNCYNAYKHELEHIEYLQKKDK